MSAETGEIFSDRSAAGRRLGALLRQRNLPAPLVVLGLPRGGVPVADEVARILRAPMDVLVVRKIGFPGQPELAIGAIAAGGVLLAGPLMSPSGLLDPALVEETVRRERRELERREQAYRAGRPPLDVGGKTVVLVDDGLATGSTMLAAIQAVRKMGAVTVVCAAPVGSPEAAARVGGQADDVLLLQAPHNLSSIGEWYEDFRQLDDTEVQHTLAIAWSESSPATMGRQPVIVRRHRH